MPRTIIDISSLARWRGPPTGIPRCQMRYARYAAKHLPDVAFTVFDPYQRRFRMLSERWARAVLDGTARIDMTMAPDPTGLAPRSIERIPRLLREPYWWVTKFRRKTVAALEQARLASTVPTLRSLAARLQEWAIPRRQRHLFFAADGSRVDWPSLDRMAGAPLALREDDTTIAMQYDWLDTDMRVVAAMKKAAGSRHVVLCHDIIPLQTPQWYPASDIAKFETYYRQAFALADLLIFTSSQTARDAAAYCAAAGIEIAPHAVVAMGSDAAPAPEAGGRLPDGLEAEKYVLFVSTIEPRKNHALILDAWRRLVDDGTVAASGFKLVFAGRKGWMMDSLFERLQEDARLRSTVRHIGDADDTMLSRLYRDAAFCVYPPKFEGFGLPPVEALASGKALIVSNAGPIPEIVGDFAVQLDPADPDGWTARMRAWMSGSPERAEFAERARQHYRPLTWNDSARAFFAAALRRD